MSKTKSNGSKKVIIENPDTGETMTREEAIRYQCPDDEADFMFAANMRQTMAEEEEEYAKAHALQYKRENEVLRYQLQEERKSHEMEIARLKAKYEADLKNLRYERNRLAHNVEVPSPQKDAGAQKDLMLSLTEMSNHVIERFSKSGAEEVSTMLYHFAVEYGFLEKDVLMKIDGIVPAIIQRDKPQQNINMPQVSQVNINPQKVTNHFKDKE